MADALGSHGGDGHEIWVDKNGGLGHLLRIVTPEDAFEAQPIWSQAADIRLLFCGRLDNRNDLLRELGPFETEWSRVPDSAVASKAYLRWGADCVNRIIGDYVMAAWQPREQRVVFVRAPLSDRTMYYNLHGETLAFATSPLGLFALPFVSKELDRERLADYVVRAPVEPDRTFYKDIKTVEGGSVTTVDVNGVRTQLLWHPNSLPEIRFKSDDEYMEAFRERFDLSVKTRLRSAFPLAAMMSGGIDSSSVACTAAGELAGSGQRLHVFTQVPREPSDRLENDYYTDETPFVQAIARMYPNMDLHLVPTKTGSVLAGHGAFIAASGAPFRNMGNRPWIEGILHQAHSVGARVVLTGAQGNTAFSWSGKGVLPGMVRRGQFVRAWRHARALEGKKTLRRFLGHGILPLLPGAVWLAVMRRLYPDDVQLAANPTWSAFSPLRRDFEQAQRVRERARDKRVELVPRQGHNSLAERIALLKFGESLGPEICCGLEARSGVEMRDPTADRRLVEFCLSIPEEQFQLNGVPRSLPRRAMADRWPPEVAANTCRGLQNSDWHDVMMRSLPELKDAFDRISTSPLATEILDLGRMRRILDTIEGRKSDSIHTFVDVLQILYLGLGLGQFFEWIEGAGVSN